MLKQKKFKNLIHNDKSQLDFFRSFRRLNSTIGCYYMGYILEDLNSSLRAGFTTNMLWGMEYINQYIDHCHLWNQVQYFYDNSLTNSLILPWSIIPTSKSIQKDIISRRKELFIGSDGISFCKKIGHLREYYYFAPEINQNNFVRYVSNNLEAVKNEIKIFRNKSLQLISVNIKSHYYEC